MLTLLFISDDNVDILLECMINKDYNYIQILDLLNNYKHSDYMFNYKKLFIHILAEISIFNNKKFFLECQKKLSKNISSNEKNINDLKVLIQRVYNELYITIYDTENYHVNHDLDEIYEIDDDFNLNKKALADFDIILNDVYAYELLYNYKTNKLKDKDIIKIINEYASVEQVIKRKIDYEILIFQKPGNHKSYCSTTEGLKNIMDD